MPSKYLFPTLSVRVELTITKLGIWWIVLFPTRANFVRVGIEPTTETIANSRLRAFLHIHPEVALRTTLLITASL